jgi:hypothetical protein
MWEIFLQGHILSPGGDDLTWLLVTSIGQAWLWGPYIIILWNCGVGCNLVWLMFIILWNFWGSHATLCLTYVRRFENANIVVVTYVLRVLGCTLCEYIQRFVSTKIVIHVLEQSMSNNRKSRKKTSPPTPPVSRIDFNFKNLLKKKGCMRLLRWVTCWKKIPFLHWRVVNLIPPPPFFLHFNILRDFNIKNC